MPRLLSGAACDRPETTEISKLPPFHEVVWQQPTEIVTYQDNLNITHNGLNFKDECSKPNVATKGKPTTEPRGCHETTSRKLNTESASTVP